MEGRYKKNLNQNLRGLVKNQFSMLESVLVNQHGWRSAYRYLAKVHKTVWTLKLLCRLRSTELPASCFQYDEQKYDTKNDNNHGAQEVCVGVKWVREWKTEQK